MKNYFNLTIRNKKNNNSIPCIMYNKNINIPCNISLLDVKKIIKKEKNIITLYLNKKKNICLIKDIQYNVFRNKIYHIDFYKIESNKKFKCYINVKTIGEPIGITKGGLCYIVLKKIKIYTDIKNYINEFLIDISKLDIGDKIYIKDILKDNIKILHDLNKIIITIKMKKVLKEE